MERAVEVSAIVGGERAALNERVLHRALWARAQTLTTSPSATICAASNLFQSFAIGGFECATHKRRDGRRLDLIAATLHDRNVASDYRLLSAHGIRTARDGLRWHLIECQPGHYDWSSFVPMLRAARDEGMQVIWDLAHWGWPDGLDIWGPDFVPRFADFAAAVAKIVRAETGCTPFYTPVNEISFWSWAGGSLGYISPLASGRGSELKRILVRAAIAAMEAIRAVEPQSRFVHSEPAINVLPRSSSPDDQRAASSYTLAQFEALDMMSGRLDPDLGGRSDYIDIIGVNYYLHNQWTDGDLPIAIDHPEYKPLHVLLGDTYRRYDRPIFIAETGIEGDPRPAWLRIVANEVATACRCGVPVEGICSYPIVDYPGWDDDRHCPTGLFGYVDDEGRRPVYEPFASEFSLMSSFRS